MPIDLANPLEPPGFALYRALIRQGLRVPLPDDVATGLGPINPIKSLIRNGFRRNKHDTSARLVVLALKNGYRFLSLLHDASQTPPRPAHADVVAFLRDNQTRVLAARDHNRAAAEAAAPSPRPNTSRAAKPKIPLLTRVREGTRTRPPVYEPTARPLPLAALRGGVRKLPTMDDCMGIPFLRLGKPQSPMLSAVIRSKMNRRQARIERLKALREEGAVDAQDEDMWEELIEKQMPEAAAANRSPGPPARKEGTYTASVRQAVWDLSTSLTMELDDMVARGRAMWKLVEAERGLAKKEARDRKRQEKLDRKRTTSEAEDDGNGAVHERNDRREAIGETENKT